MQEFCIGGKYARGIWLQGGESQAEDSDFVRICASQARIRMSNSRPGMALKSLRKRNGWTLADVSNRSGVPASTLSRIENDQISPTYDLLLRLSNGLSLDVSELLSNAAIGTRGGPEQLGRRSVNRRSDGEVVPMTNHTLRYLSTDLLNKQITPILCEYRAKTLEEFGEFMHHEGEEFLYVMDGQLVLHTDCYAPLALGPGESVYFDSRMSHAYIAGGEGACHALSICTVPRSPETARRADAKPMLTVNGSAAGELKRPPSKQRARRRRSG
jgi:transcriptional regulator with XRE-family HTH domain